MSKAFEDQGKEAQEKSAQYTVKLGECPASAEFKKAHKHLTNLAAEYTKLKRQEIILEEEINMEKRRLQKSESGFHNEEQARYASMTISGNTLAHYIPERGVFEFYGKKGEIKEGSSVGLPDIFKNIKFKK